MKVTANVKQKFETIFVSQWLSQNLLETVGLVMVFPPQPPPPPPPPNRPFPDAINDCDSNSFYPVWRKEEFLTIKEVKVGQSIQISPKTKVEKQRMSVNKVTRLETNPEFLNVPLKSSLKIR